MAHQQGDVDPVGQLAGAADDTGEGADHNEADTLRGPKNTPNEKVPASGDSLSGSDGTQPLVRYPIEIRD